MANPGSSSGQVTAGFCFNNFNRVMGAADSFSGLENEWEGETVSVENFLSSLSMKVKAEKAH